MLNGGPKGKIGPGFSKGPNVTAKFLKKKKRYQQKGRSRENNLLVSLTLKVKWQQARENEGHS